MVNIKTAEALAWVKKYFNASVDIKLLLFIKGIKTNKLISSSIQALNLELDCNYSCCR